MASEVPGKHSRLGIDTLDLDVVFGAKDSVKTFEASLLGAETSVRVLDLVDGDVCRDLVLSEKEIENYLQPLNDQNDLIRTTVLQNNGPTKAATIFVNRFLVRPNEPWPDDARKLRLSQSSFELLRSHMQLPWPFLNALANIHHPSPRRISIYAGGQNLNSWFFIPVRVQVRCLDKNSHCNSRGQSQMNPVNYLHLNHPDIDIRGSKIAVYYSFNTTSGQAFSLVFNFQDGRWKKVVEEPILRLREIYQTCNSVGLGRDPVYLQATILNSVLRWWNNSLHSFNDQLIAYEEILIHQDLTSEDLSRINTSTNQSLHCMAAHLHRYGSELRSLSDILLDLKTYNRDLHEKFVVHGVRDVNALGNIMATLEQADSYLVAIRSFRDELQQKIDNVLALLVDNTQSMSDRLLVQNSKATQAILQATQEEAALSRQVAIQSQRLAEEMMKDSVAMKTIAILTTIFLPGTSFAAIMSMPFFNDDPWLKSEKRLWIWLLLTIPATLVCFWFYISWSRRESRRKKINAYDLEVRPRNAEQGTS